MCDRGQRESLSGEIEDFALAAEAGGFQYPVLVERIVVEACNRFRRGG